MKYTYTVQLLLEEESLFSVIFEINMAIEHQYSYKNSTLFNFLWNKNHYTTLLLLEGSALSDYFLNENDYTKSLLLQDSHTSTLKWK